ncbi:MAG: hypothetical protein RL266_2477 [Bacteroidota bacterium]|jgi:hypothetical protein
MSSSAATNIVEFLKLRLNRRSVAFFLCLVLSGLFWLLTSLSKEYVHEVRIPVVYENMPENMLLVNEPTAEVKAEVQGRGFDLLWHMLNLEKVEIAILANPSVLPSIRKDRINMHYALTAEKTGLMTSMGDDQLDILRISPDTLFLHFRPLFTKTVPVRLRADISFVKQYGMTEKPTIEPESIVLSGLREALDTIEFVMTEKQNWNNLDESLTAEVPLVSWTNSRVVRYSQESVQVALNVQEYTEGMVKIPVTVETANAASVKVYPGEVELRYQVPLSEYDRISADQFQATVRLDIDAKGLRLLSVEVTRSPISVRQVRVIPEQVEYIVQK